MMSRGYSRKRGYARCDLNIRRCSTLSFSLSHASLLACFFLLISFGVSFSIFIFFCLSLFPVTVYFYLSICLSFSVYLCQISICLFFSVYRICLDSCIRLCLSVCLSVCLSFSVCRVCLGLSVSLYLSLALSIYLLQLLRLFQSVWPSSSSSVCLLSVYYILLLCLSLFFISIDLSLSVFVQLCFPVITSVLIYISIPACLHPSVYFFFSYLSLSSFPTLYFPIFSYISYCVYLCVYLPLFVFISPSIFSVSSSLHVSAYLSISIFSCRASGCVFCARHCTDTCFHSYHVYFNLVFTPPSTYFFFFPYTFVSIFSYARVSLCISRDNLALARWVFQLSRLF